MESNASGSTSKSKTASRKINWEKVAWHVAVSVGTGLLSGVAMGAGQAIFGTVAGTAGEAAATAGTVISLAKKAI